MGTPPRVVELRVHGVSGTPPHSMLGLDDPRDVRRLDRGGTDDLTGFYVARHPAKTSGPSLPADGSREAYSWGSLTSSAGGLLGWVRRALWLTLLPFAMVNVAMWSRPGLAQPGVRRWLPAVLIRTAGLLLTGLLVATACGIGVDLYAWQCFRQGVPACPALPGFLSFLGSDTFDDPGRRLAVGQAVPLLMLLGFWWLSRTTINSYEAVVAGTTDTAPAAGAPKLAITVSNRLSR